MKLLSMHVQKMFKKKECHYNCSKYFYKVEMDKVVQITLLVILCSRRIGTVCVYREPLVAIYIRRSYYLLLLM